MLGTLSYWFVNRNTSYSEPFERQVIADRAENLVSNDPHATSGIDSIVTNSIGTGLIPQSRPKSKMLGGVIIR